ncbi:HAD hydrolase-like protein [Streptomyces sp. NBC_00654]|uniref:HAD hydrolase-like protein n=1 Tax=Streptomyces sp. NBC_00654 TaxID=2975799 RepID=UPI0022547DB9|nr:HAD hydrolase-like protein [Streptomyces sp. NBC_00654]MCX4967251.1 HAD hydrolase-like protein [Streptomyces sp. NBC_00654]
MTVIVGTLPVQETVHRLRAHLAGLVDVQGRLHCPCSSRVLESALTLRLLDTEGCHHQARARLRAFLEKASSRPGAGGLDRLLARAALSRPPAPGAGDDDVLAGFVHHTAVRKRILMDTVLHLAGTPGTLPRRGPEEFVAGELHSWKRPEMLACHLIHLHAHRDTGQVAAADLEPLAAVLSGEHIHERNHLSHLLYLFALRPYSAHRHLVDAGIERLVATQGADGGFSLSRDIDTWVTSVGGLALSEAGADRGLLDRTCAWLAARQADDGGWSFTEGVAQTDADTAYTVLKLLHRHAPARYANSLEAGHAYLRRMQNPDGGWPVYRRTNPSEAAMTGGALSALCDRPHANAAAITAGARWLIRNQQGDGAFERSWSLSEGNALFRSVHGLNAALGHHLLDPETAGHARTAVHRASDCLRAGQNDDGGWGHGNGAPSDPISTGYALAALGPDARPDVLHAAATYLIARQRPDGGFDSTPDTVSPRPIPLDLPALAPAYILRGLTHALPTGPPPPRKAAVRPGRAPAHTVQPAPGTSRYRAQIFDFDGTLVDTAEVNLHAVHAALTAHGTHVPLRWLRTVPLADLGVLRRHLLAAHGLVPACTDADIVRAARGYWLAHTHQVRPVAAVAAAAHAAAEKGPVAVASANDGHIVRAGLAAAGLAHLFTIIVTREDVAALKPAPDAFLTAASLLEVEPARCLAYENTDEGISAAHTARMDTIDIRATPWTVRRPPHTYRSRSFSPKSNTWE